MRLDYPRFLFHDLFHGLGYETATISSQNEEWQGMRRFETTATPTFFFHSLDHPGPHLGRGAERKLPDHLTVDRLFAWLDARRDGSEGEPWAAYVNFQRTHFPYELPPGYHGAHQPSDPEPSTFGFLGYPVADVPVVINRYDNALAYVDAQVGRVVEYLERTGQAERTLIAVVADHGEVLAREGASPMARPSTSRPCACRCCSTGRGRSRRAASRPRFRPSTCCRRSPTWWARPPTRPFRGGASESRRPTLTAARPTSSLCRAWAATTASSAGRGS